MPPRISPLKDAIHHIVLKTDKTWKLEVKYINAKQGKVLSYVIYQLIITNVFNHDLISIKTSGHIKLALDYSLSQISYHLLKSVFVVHITID